MSYSFLICISETPQSPLSPRCVTTRTYLKSEECYLPCPFRRSPTTLPPWSYRPSLLLILQTWITST